MEHDLKIFIVTMLFSPVGWILIALLFMGVSIIIDSVKSKSSRVSKLEADNEEMLVVLQEVISYGIKHGDVLQKVHHVVKKHK